MKLIVNAQTGDVVFVGEDLVTTYMPLRKPGEPEPEPIILVGNSPLKDSEVLQTLSEADESLLNDSSFPGLPWRYAWIGGELTRELVAPSVPESITAWQAQAALKLTPYSGGGTLYDAAAAAIAGMEESTPEEAMQKVVVQTAWDNNANFSRNSATILSFASTLGLTDSDLDQLFITGSRLSV